MPFEPRIFEEAQGAADQQSADPLRSPDAPDWDDAEQLELTDDLGLLAEQLRDDATYLAQTHPADATPQQREAAWRKYNEDEKRDRSVSRLASRLWISAAAAALLLTASVSLTFYLYSSSNNHSGPIDGDQLGSAHALAQHDNTDAISTTATTTGSMDVTPVRENRSAADELPLQEPRLIPAAMLREVTAPELDAMLDLLSEEDSGLSI